MIRYTNYGRPLSTGISGFFILAYLWVFLGGPAHHLAHIEQEEVCEEPDNACHLKLNHSDELNGCDHEFHFTQEGFSCDLCVLFQSKSESTEASTGYSITIFWIANDQQAITPSAYYTEESLEDSRGPPLNS